jgi:hypothetical protein
MKRLMHRSKLGVSSFFDVKAEVESRLTHTWRWWGVVGFYVFIAASNFSAASAKQSIGCETYARLGREINFLSGSRLDF